MYIPNFVKIGPLVFEIFNIFAGFLHHAPCAMRHAPCAKHQGRNQPSYRAISRIPCLINSALLIVESQNIVFKCFEGLRTRISDFRSDSPDRKSTLQRSQNVKSGLFMRVWCSNLIFKGYVVCRWWLYDFRSDSPDRKSTLQRSQNV